MAQRRLARKLLLAATLTLLVLAVPGAWLAVRLPATLRTPVRGGKTPAGLETGLVEVPAPSPAGPAGSGSLLPNAAGVSAGGGDRPAASVAPELEGAETLSGVVLTPEGAPIAGARVDAARSPEPRSTAATALRREEEVVEPLLARRAASGSTDDRGRFDIGGLAGGRYDLEITARGFGRRNVAGAPTHGVTLREGTLRIVLHPELWMRGEVVDRRAKSIAGTEVTLTFLAADANDLDSSGGDEGRRPPRASAAHRARTDAGGRFSLGGLGRGVYRAEASGAGYSPAIAALVEVHDPDTARETYLVFELDEGHRLRGVVRSKGGEPLPGARVRLRAPSAGREIEAIAGLGREVRAATSGADGTFELASLPAETYQLAVSASAHRDRTLENVTAGGEAVQIVLEPRAPLEGRVVDRRSGDPVPDAEVRWQAAGGAWGDAEPAPAAHTDAAGGFRIERFPEDGHAIRIDAEGYSTLEIDAADAGGGSAWTLALERSGSVSGRVQAARDLSVEGLRVSLVELTAPPVVPAATANPSRSEESGRFRLVPGSSHTDAGGFYRVFVPGSGSYRVVVDGHPYVAASSEVLIVPDNQAQIESADISLALAATAQGFVFSRDLGRVAGARVKVTPDRSTEEAQPASGDPQPPGAAELAAPLRGHTEARADATGAFTVGGLHAGGYRIVAGAPGFVTARSESFYLAAGGTQVVELELEPEMMITGRVVNGDGGPIPMAEIRAVVNGESAGELWSEERSIASVVGTFRLSRLAARSYDLRFAAEGFAPAVLWRVAAGSDNAEVRLERLVSLSGKVLGAFTGEPVVEFKLRLRFEEEHRLSAREKESLHGWRSFSDPAGAFRIDDLPPGRYLVEANAPGHIGVDGLELEVPSQVLEDAAIRLAEAGLITGVVVDGHGNAVASARVEALQRKMDPDRGTVSFRPISLPSPRSVPGAGESPSDGGGERRRGRDGDRLPAAVTTKDDGSFVLRGLPNGVYRLSITHDDYLSRELGDYAFENGLSGDAPVTLSILLPFGVALLGRVRGAAGVEGSVVLRPVPPDSDSRARRAARSKSARVDDSGRFEIRGLEVGDYVLQARFRKAADGSYVSIRRDVRIHGAGREQGILLDLSR